MNVRSQEHVADLTMEIAKTSLTSDLRQCAILLDIDGTILDIAPTPREVWVPPKLRQTLARLQDLTGGALALVSGRLLADIDLIFAPLQLAAVGGHGAELRPMPSAEPQRRAASLSPELKRTLATLTRIGSGHSRRGQRLFARPALSACSGSRSARCRRRSSPSATNCPPARSRFCPARLSSKSNRCASAKHWRSRN